MQVRVVIVDDSPFFREVLRDLLCGYRGVEVVGEAGDGRQAVEVVREQRPDVVTMDMLMPMLGGVDAIGRIMAERPTPIVVLAADGGDPKGLALRALGAGALDVFTKPSHGFDREQTDAFVALLRATAHRRAVGAAGDAEAAEPVRRLPSHAVRCMGLVSSTGGPQLLRRLLEELPATLGAPLAIVQHTIRGFTAPLASWLDAFTPLRVRVAEHGTRLRPGDVVIAPDDSHLAIDGDLTTRLLTTEAVASLRPSGTILLRSIAQSFGRAGMGVVVTGMGRDGADGLAAIEQAGGTILVQSPETAAIGGMPRAAVDATRAPYLVSPEQLAAVISERAGTTHAQ